MKTKEEWDATHNGPTEIKDANQNVLRTDAEPAQLYGHLPGCLLPATHGGPCSGERITNPLPVRVNEQGDYEFVQAPKHYNDHPSGVECQVIIRECKDPMISFAMKHLWRSQWGGKPGQSTDQDLSKAIEYIQLEQARRAGKDRL